MSSADSKRSKRRRNKRGGGNTRPATGIAGAQQQSANGKTDGQVMATIPVPSSLTDLDLDNIPQPLSQMPRSHNPYLDREHCLLCRRERPDPPSHRIPQGVGSEKETNGQLPITQMPLWLCPDCRRTVEEEEANSTKGFDPSAIGELLLPPTLPLITGLQNLDVAFSTSQGGGGDALSSLVTSSMGGKGGGSSAGVGEGPCQCEPCRERREIAAEQEHSRQQLGECWTELSHLVRCVYWEAGTSLTGEESTTKLSLPRMQELVRRLVGHDPHLLHLRLEAEVEDFIKEMRERLLKQLDGGFRTPPLAKQFITMLLEEYAALCSAAQTLLPILEELEKEHLHKFNLTWPLHNKHLFHSLIYMEPGLHDNLGTLIKQLRTVASQKEPYHEESYSSLLQRYFQFDNDMSVVGVVWRDCQQLIEDYTDEQELYKGKDALNRSWDMSVPSSRPRPLSCEANKTANNRGLYPCHSALIGHLGGGVGSQEATTNHKGSTKKKCLCDDCSLDRLTSNLFTHDLYEEMGLKHLAEAVPGGQLSNLDSYLESIHPPDLSSTSSSSSCSSQGDSAEIPIFSRSDLIPSGYSSPRSDDSDDSDDLDSESSPSPSHDNAFDDEEEEGEARHNENSTSRGRARCRAADRQNSSDLKKDSNISSNQPCECHNCTSHHGSHLPAATMMTAGVGDKIDLPTKPSYLFYPNLGGHQPLDLSHHGITAKHPLIHPHLYNFPAQKPTKLPAHSQQQQSFQLNLDTPDGLHAYGDWNSAYESAKMVLHSHSHAHYGHEDAPDLVQSVKAALQSNCRLEKRESQAKSAHQGHDSSDGKSQKEEKMKRHSHDHGSVSNGIGEWTKQQRAAAYAQHGHEATKGKSSSLIAQELCAKHNLPTVPKLPNNNLFFPSPLLQAADAAGVGGTLTNEALAQQFSQGVQQALMTQGMLGTPGAGLQLQNAGIHMADVHHLQQQQQQQQHASAGSKKKNPSGEDTSPAEPTVTLPEYLNEQHLQACSHQNHGSHPSTTLPSSTGLCNSSMQTTTSTPTASISSDADYETPNYGHDDDTPSNYDDKESNASSTTRERESKHCECCYCEFFGQGPQPAPTSRNYTEIRDRLRLRLRERKQPKDQSPSHEEPPRPPVDVLNSDERKVEDLLSFIEGAKKTKSNSKAAKRQRQRQKKAEQKEQKAKSVHKDGHQNDVTVPVSLHHHHYHHHHHHHVEVTPAKQHEAKQHTANCKLQQAQPHSKQHPQSQAVHPVQAKSTATASKGQPRPPQQPSDQSPSSCRATTPLSTAITSSTAASSLSLSAQALTAKAAQVASSQEMRGDSKKGKALPSQDKAATPSSNPGNKATESKAKGKQNGAGKQGPSLTPAADGGSSGGREKELEKSQTQESGKQQRRDQGTNGKQQPQPTQQRQTLNQKQQQPPKEKSKSSKQEDRNSWKAGQERLVNGNASDSSSGSSSRSNSVGSKSINSKTKQNNTPPNHLDDIQSKKQSAKSSQNHPATTVQSTPKIVSTSVTKKAHSNITTSGTKESAPQKMEEAPARMASKRMENNHHNKQDSHMLHNGGPQESLPNGTAMSNGNGTTSKRRKKKKNSDNPNASIDEIFLPKENIDMNEMDETERELEAFKRFCMASTPQQHKEKVVFNVKDLSLKKSSLQAH